MAEGEVRPAFGNRLLLDQEKVFEHNAWDRVEWEEEQETEARRLVQANSCQPLSEEVREKSEQEAAHHWSGFYQQHQNKFFKDRHWLFTEFPELKGPAESKFSMFEVGCGVGNTVFPILQLNTNPHLFIHCCDFAESAVELLKGHSAYDSSRCHAFQFDITNASPLPIPEGTLDIITLIFVLSAISPLQHQFVMSRLSRLLRPGGLLLFRDYGELDMAQLRFKKGRCLSENFYLRGDGTHVYFFKEDEVDTLFCEAGLRKEQLYTDKRLQVNRGKQLKMYRVWIQAKYSKTEDSLPRANS